MMKRFLERKDALYILLGINLLIRMCAAALTDLGNDEVYYTTYALFPSWGYFDHPPAVGLLIKWTTLDFYFTSAFFVRLGSLLLGTLNLYLIYRMASDLAGRRAGIWAVAMLSVSLYASIIVGTFIMPDTPQSTLWLVGLWLFIRYIDTQKTWAILTFGVVVGLALLAKYHAIFLWGGAGLYVLLFDRKRLLSPWFWVAGLLSIAIFTPLILWNIEFPGYSGFSYHAGRVGDEGGAWWPSLKFFFPEFFGQILYNNPFNVGIIVLAAIFLYRERQTLLYGQKKILFLCLMALPLMLVTLSMALYNQTLPHWSGPSYYAWTLLAVYAFSHKKNAQALYRGLKGGFVFFGLVFGVALLQVQTGLLLGDTARAPEKLGQDDFTIDLSVWEEAVSALSDFVDMQQANDSLAADFSIVTHNWFPAAHLDHYYAVPANIPLYVWGNSERQHHYIKINHLRGEPKQGSDALFITASHFKRDPQAELLEAYAQIQGPYKIPVHKTGKLRMYLWVWKLQDLQTSLNLANHTGRTPEK